jgi:hypothetical protein
MDILLSLDLAKADGTLTNVLQHRALQRRSGDGGRAGEHGAQQVSLFFRLEHAVDDTWHLRRSVGSVLGIHSDRSPEIAPADFIKEVLGILNSSGTMERRC